MEVTRSSVERATTKVAAERFSGDVYIDSVAGPAAAPSRVQAFRHCTMPFEARRLSDYRASWAAHQGRRDA